MNKLIKSNDFETYNSNNKAKIYILLCEFYDELKEFDVSLKIYNEVAKCVADILVAKSRKKCDEASNLLQRALELDPQSTNALDTLRRYYMKQKQFNIAYKYDQYFFDRRQTLIYCI